MSNSKSVVVGGESLLTSVYRSLNAPHLKPCLQRSSESSIAFLRYDLAISPKASKKSKKGITHKIKKGILKKNSVVNKRKIYDPRISKRVDIQLNKCEQNPIGSRKEPRTYNQQCGIVQESHSEDEATDSEESVSSNDSKNEDNEEIGTEVLPPTYESVTEANDTKISQKLTWDASTANFTKEKQIEKESHEVLTFDALSNYGTAYDESLSTSVLNRGQSMKPGMLLIYLNGKLLYSGYPFPSYGCKREDFMEFVSSVTGVKYI
ncbi:uncharacterized protein LOC125177912 [Hyalella azteca]|uniref:Uncharacterized protein LOC125177912 n=1 Tax=Hyalella azteca TaxID=294128 RepID=A0A979FJW3_HYAAZ|nr:uncharacterized protein LOC125177912 [Hyalella azteca]